MPTLGEKSKERLATCHPELIRVVEWAIKAAPPTLDFAVVCGHRNEAAQAEAFAKGTSSVQWPNSKHNAFPSLAVDLAPWDPVSKRIPWEDTAKFNEVAGLILGVAGIIQVDIEWGGYWRVFVDRPHFQLRSYGGGSLVNGHGG